MNRFQIGFCLSLIVSVVFGFYTTKLDAQDSAGPKLIAPFDGAVMDNGRTDRFDVTRWEFEWAPVPNADKYRIKVQGKSAKIPTVNRVIADTRFTKESTNYIIARNLKGWTWKVQARVNGKWGNWSEERTFDVEPLDTDLATSDVPNTDEANEHHPKTQINDDIRGTSTYEILSRLQEQNEIDFDEDILIHEPVASYIRYKPGAASHEHLRFSADGKYVAIGGMSPPKSVGNGRMRSSGGGRIELWNVQSGKQTILSDDIKTFIHPTIFPVAFSQDSKLLAAADTNGQIKIWELSAEKFSEPKVFKFKDKGQNSGIVTALCFTPDSKRILVGAHPTHQLEIESGEEIELCKGFSSSFLKPDVIELSPDGRMVAFGGRSTGVNFFDRNSGEFSDQLKQHRLFKEVYFYQFLPSGKLGVVAGGQPFGGKKVGVNDNSVGKITSAISFNGEFPAVAVSLDGSTLAVADAEIKKSAAYLTWQKQYQDDFKDEELPTLVSLWRINGRKLEFLGQVNTGNKEMVTAIGLSPDGTTLVTSGANLRFWDINSIRLRQSKKALETKGVENPTVSGQAPGGMPPIQLPYDKSKGLSLQNSQFIANTATFGELFMQFPYEIRTLNLKNAAITESQFANLKHFKKLQTLDVSGTKFGDEGIKALLKLPELRSLNLARTKITEKGLKLVRDLPETIKISVTSRRNDINSNFSDAALSQCLPNFYPILLHVEKRVELEPIAEFATGSTRWPPVRETAVSNNGKWAVLILAGNRQNAKQLKLVNLESGRVTNIDSTESNNSQFRQFSTGKTVVFSPDTKNMIAVFDNKLSIWNLEKDQVGPAVTIAETQGQCSIDVNFKTKRIALNQSDSIRIYDLLTLKLIKATPADFNQSDVPTIGNDLW